MAWIVTLLLAAPASRSLPDGDRIYVFTPGKPISVPDHIAERCLVINKRHGAVFSLREDSVAPTATEPTPELTKLKISLKKPKKKKLLTKVKKKT